jgi:hypothetical protein
MDKMSCLARWSAPLVLTAFLSGCAGGRSMVVARDAEYPVSLSRGVRDAQGMLVPAADRSVVGKLHVVQKAWTILWSAVTINPEMDISRQVNAQVAAAQGDAVVHLTLVTKHCDLNYFAFPFGLLPIWPSCADVDITGDIVKVRRAAGPTTIATTAAPQERGL